jgi:hypothetical protein
VYWRDSELLKGDDRPEAMLRLMEERFGGARLPRFGEYDALLRLG